MTLRLASFGLITSLFVGVIYVITKPLILESKEEARIAELYALAEPLLSDGTIQTPISKELPNDAPTSLVGPLLITPIVNTTGQIGAVIPFRSTEGYSGTIQLLIALDNNQRIVGLRAIDHRETPGLGDKIDTKKLIGSLSSMVCPTKTYPQTNGLSKKTVGDLIALLERPLHRAPLWRR